MNNEYLVFIEAYRNYDIYLDKRNYLFNTPVLPDLDCKEVRELKEAIDEVITKEVGKEIVFYNNHMQICRITSITSKCFWMTEEGACLDRRKYSTDIFKNPKDTLFSSIYYPMNEDVEAIMEQRRNLRKQMKELHDKEDALIEELNTNYSFNSFSEVLEYGALKNQDRKERKGKK